MKDRTSGNMFLIKVNQKIPDQTKSEFIDMGENPSCKQAYAK